MMGRDMKEVRIGPKKEMIPKNWNVKELSQVSKNNGQYGANESAEEFDAEQFRYIRITDISEDGRLKNNDKKSIEKKEENEKYILNEGDIVFARTGSVGRTYLYKDRDTEITCVFAGYLIKFELNSKEIDYDYLSHYTHSYLYNSWINSFSRSTTLANINATEYSTLPIIYPPLPEQKKIADVLSSVDQAIEKTDQIIAKTQELKKGLMQELLTKGIGHDEFKEVRIGSKKYEIPRNWNLVRLEKMFDLINGRSFKKNEWSNEGLQIIRIQDLRENENSETNYCNFEVKDKYYVNKGDLLFCWAGNINTSLGAYIWNKEKAVLNQHIYNLKSKEKNYNEYYKNYLNYMLPLLKTLVGGSAGQIHITKGDLNSFKLLVPPLEEQKKIANILSSVDNKIQKKQEQKEKLEELKKGLMQKLLTGEVRVDVEE